MDGGREGPFCNARFPRRLTLFLLDFPGSGVNEAQTLVDGKHSGWFNMGWQRKVEPKQLRQNLIWEGIFYA